MLGAVPEDMQGETPPPSRPLDGWGWLVVGATLALLGWSSLVEITRGGAWDAVLWRGVSAQTARDVGALDLFDVWNRGQWWRLWTCAWVHARACELLWICPETCAQKRQCERARTRVPQEVTRISLPSPSL